MRTIILCGLLLMAASLYAQPEKEYKFGKVTTEDFRRNVYEIDSNAAAVVIADIGSTELTGNTKGSFSLLFRNYRRAHILNKSGFDISDVSIPLYRIGDREERIEQLKAVTYNLENGKVVETKLDQKDALFKDVIDKNWVVRKFTFPNVKEGSIIEYEYRVMSDFYSNLQGWEFQGEYPVLWSQYEIKIPDFLTYLTIAQGSQDFAVYEKSTVVKNFTMADGRGLGRTETYTFSSPINNIKWAMKNVPALKPESYTSTIRNHISKIEFQLSAISHPFEPRSFMDTWPTVAKTLLEDEEFGAQLSRDNGWLQDVTAEAVKGASDDLEKSRNVFSWVRDHFTCTDHSRLYMNHTLREVLKSKNGSVAEINLLLTAMLRRAGIQADPVILGTRSHGYVHPVYPILQRFNYVICRAMVGDKTYFLDASETMNGFGRVSTECYNGHAVVVNQEATPLKLSSDLLKEESYTTVFMTSDEKGNIVASVKLQPGTYESRSIRREIREKGVAAYAAGLGRKHGSEYSAGTPEVSRLEQLEENLEISYKLKFEGEKEDILYLNPMFGTGYSDNPFKSQKRLYPVEMPYTVDETLNVNIQVPTGYTVDELPAQAVVKLNESGTTRFEYRLSRSGDMISFRSRILIGQTFFHPDDYELLREFFNLIVKKQSEQIVFKKIP